MFTSEKATTFILGPTLENALKLLKIMIFCGAILFKEEENFRKGLCTSQTAQLGQRRAAPRLAPPHARRVVATHRP
jgi:hypothetical protein